ncbi:hypothetical protein ACQPYE_10825 [Actinosynnema sp. CA-299493]
MCRPRDEWEVSFYRSLFSAHGVLLMGGGRRVADLVVPDGPGCRS